MEGRFLGQAEVAVIYSYLGSDDHMAVLNVSAYMVHKSLLHTIYSLVKKSSLAKPVSVGYSFLPLGVHECLMAGRRGWIIFLRGKQQMMGTMV